MRSTLVTDASVVYAALNRDERHHQACAELLASGLPVALPAPAVTETTMLGRSRGRPRAVDALLRSVVDGSIGIVDLEVADYLRARLLVSQYIDLGLSFPDASVVVVAERFEETTIATLDHRRFSVVKPLHCGRFTLVP